MNFAAAVLIFREGLEAALIVAIMLGYLRKVGKRDMQWAVWAGMLTATALGIAFTLALQFIGAEFEDPAEAIYEAVTAVVAVGMLTYMIFWMARQGRYVKGSLEQSMRESLATGAVLGLFGVAFITVAREGLETALFLSASTFASSGQATLVGGLVGLAAALVVAWAVYVGGVRLNMGTFFKVTSVLLVFFAASILRYGVHEFQELGWLPPIVGTVWDTSALVPEGSAAGSVLQALVGYTPNPSLLEILAYVGYLALGIGFLLGFGRVPVRPARPQTSTESAATDSVDREGASI